MWNVHICSKCCKRANICYTNWIAFYIAWQSILKFYVANFLDKVQVKIILISSNSRVAFHYSNICYSQEGQNSTENHCMRYFQIYEEVGNINFELQTYKGDKFVCFTLFLKFKELSISPQPSVRLRWDLNQHVTHSAWLCHNFVQKWYVYIFPITVQKKLHQSRPTYHILICTYNDDQNYLSLISFVFNHILFMFLTS